MDDAGLQRELNDALAVSPSPDFVARVRMRIAEPQASPMVGWLVPAVVAVSAVVIALAVALKPAPIEPARGVEFLESRPISAVVRTPTMDIAPRRFPGASNIVQTIDSDPVEIPEVLIAADNRLGLMQLLDGVRERRFEATFDETPASTPWVMTELTVPPLTSEPIETPTSNN
jgi:hypothetical protein